MAKVIDHVEIFFSEYGMRSVKQPKRKVMYVPAVRIYYVDKKRKSKTERYFDSKITKENINNYLECGSFFVIVRKPNYYHFFDADGKQVAEVEINGTAIASRENDIVIRNGNNLSWYGIDGNKIGE
jgi:hypothetical protein